jgi:hypothetical protein
MKAYVINLDKRPERMVSFNKNKFPFDVERVSAVETLDGGMGCNLSHLAILKHQKEYPFAIFEDDCVMVEPWDLVNEAISQLPKEWDALWLGGTLDAPIERYSENLFRLKKCYCTHGIIYNSRVMVEYILKGLPKFLETTKGKKIIDLFYYEDVQEKFNCYITYPMVALQAEGYSDIMMRTPGLDEHQWRLDCYKMFTDEV